MNPLVCDSCGKRVEVNGDTYEAWEDTARLLDWFVGEELVLCPRCR